MRAIIIFIINVKCVFHPIKYKVCMRRYAETTNLTQFYKLEYKRNYSKTNSLAYKI